MAKAIPQWREVGRRLIPIPPRVVPAQGRGTYAYVEALWAISERLEVEGLVRTREVAARPAYAHKGGADLQLALGVAGSVMGTLESWANRLAWLEALDVADTVEARYGDPEARGYAQDLRQQYGRARELWDPEGNYFTSADRLPLPCGCGRGADASLGSAGYYLVCRSCQQRYVLRAEDDTDQPGAADNGQ